MTAPRPDLDALEARLLDAERADLLVEHGVRHTDIKWIFAAARERDAERQQREQAEQHSARLRAALEEVRQLIRDLPAPDNDSSVAVGERHHLEYLAGRVIDAALAEGRDG